MKYASTIALFLAIIPTISSASEGGRRENLRPRPNFELQQPVRQNQTSRLDLARIIIRGIAANHNAPDALSELDRAEELIQNDPLNNIGLMRRIQGLRNQINNQNERREIPRPRPNLASQSVSQNTMPHLGQARVIVNHVSANRNEPNALSELDRAEQLIRNDHLNNLSLMRRIRNLRRQINNQDGLFNDANVGLVARQIDTDTLEEQAAGVQLGFVARQIVQQGPPNNNGAAA